ncbi:hypothetical protein A3D81_01855 [Candidatus Curtissbacteria bacterium RIFCSPHIGHO2_02_FULL_40_17]|uniref:Uncharacterized protein n=4 Tax=Candidatus Curtissiibacteriota TaxID=1752717 RepID=A0A1F5GG58_9BACT|nr:MAG: hypothetical protein A2693_02335 [Candidatus Curtissbacteria bacterium RIFCSPHIGHO2_01_FULL_40_12]OGD90862.1 MAG: hypothetical protein A3D81_01855 [Candidatus Curtissbacteria bacterium RIFCSPHIGHO2_02_FULL_40_17]OGE05748.1 MAG: hypothetical protein A3F45_04045 [Candidatus Curtissbacteria bacterium RIFCSPHIGHO2_12_FULL_41_17]OGE08762.1 MAG: hypothetical protein A3I53_00165 [Candidatus Curtissbacteria bacterium RIFCSPLOWO2_02_FULL_40_13b]
MDFGQEDSAWERINQLIDEGSCWQAANEVAQLMHGPDAKPTIDEQYIEGILRLGFALTPTGEFVSEVEAFLKERR